METARAVISCAGNMYPQKFEDIAKKDYRNMLDNVRLCTSERAKELLLMQSIEGHAKEGDGCFKDRISRECHIFPDAVIEDVVNALELNPDEIKAERQAYIDEVFEFTENIILGEKKGSYSNLLNQPLFGINFFSHIEIEKPGDLLAGMYLGSRMDNYLQWRRRVEAEYGILIGGGECIGINRKAAKAKGIPLESIAHNAHSVEDVERLVKEGVLCREADATNDVVSGYVRYAQGKGTSDDLAVILAGRIYGKDAALGVFLADAIDTWDKYVPFINANGQDEALGDVILGNRERIREQYGSDIPDETEVRRFISTISCQNFDEEMISNSQRYFLKLDEDSGISAIQSHLAYIEGNAPKKMQIGHRNSGMTNSRMYSLFEAVYKKNYNQKHHYSL